MTTRNLHRIAGVLDRLRKEAAEGPCSLCARRSTGYIEGWDLHPKGVCDDHAAQGERLGYSVHRAAQSSPEQHLIAPVCATCGNEIDKDSRGWWHVAAREGR